MFVFNVSHFFKKSRTIIGLLVLFYSPVTSADDATEAGLSADDALAHISMAQPDALGAIRTAPAILPLLPRYQVAVGGGWSSDPLRRIVLNAVDSSNGPVALGLNFRRTRGKPEANTADLPGWYRPGQSFSNETSEVVAGGSGAVSFANRQRSIGIGTHYIGRRGTFTEDVDIFEFTASGGLHIKEQLLMTVTGRDVLQNNGPVHIGTGIRWGPTDTSFNGSPFRSYGGIEFNVDTLLDQDGYKMGYWGISGDVLLTDMFILRSGYRQESDIQAIGVGFAIDNISYGFEIGSLLYLNEEGLSRHSHSAGLRIRL